MQRSRNINWSLYFILGILLIGCKTKTVSEEGQTKASTPVTVAGISEDRLTEYIELNAVSVFQKKNIIRSTTSGFLSSVNLNPGSTVNSGNILFSLITREAAAIEKNSSVNDSTIHFKGEINIQASQKGIVSSIAHQQGDYVQEGDELATIAEPSSLVYYLQVPYEKASYIHKGQECDILFPDKEKAVGIIGDILPSADALSQTIVRVVKPIKYDNVPENLIVRIKISKSVKNTACTLPKEAILTNETQTDFWVMKLLNDTIAVKVPVQKGIEQENKTEILSPVFEKTDRFIITGNYGLEDTARVNIVK